MKLSELYRRASPAGGRDPIAKQILFQRHWINSVPEFDPKTGEVLPLGISRVLQRIDRIASSSEFRDHTWFITDHCQESIHRIIDQMSESPRRRHEYMHVAKVRELDVSSYVALSYRPGRNIREKLSHKPQMKAVRRFQSIDLPQNQLFKEFVRQLSDLLEDRALYLGYEDDILPLLRRWLRSEEADQIGSWRNLPPNNTLLSHPDYRRIWNAWNWLSQLEPTLGKGLEELAQNQLVIDTWERLAADHRSGSLTVAEIPVRVEIENFKITTLIDWSEVKFGPTADEARYSAEQEQSTRAVCIDLTTTFPRYAVDENESIQRLSSPLIWQSWRFDNETIDLELFEADAAHLHEVSTTYSIVDLFFKKRPDEKAISRAARSFVERLRVGFRDPTLLWLVPDNVNEFRLGILRRNLNSRFPKAQPLPRSVAAAFNYFPYDEIPKGGIKLAVLDKAAGSTFVTELIAEHDPELEEQVPETRGFYWVRRPHIELRNDRGGYEQLSEFDYVGSDGNWVQPLELPERPTADVEEVDRVIAEEPRILEIHDTPVKGGLRYLRLQALAGDIPLWRDAIPRLAMSGFVDRRGRPGTLVLVPEAYPVHLVRGESVSIPVESDFYLPHGQTSYRFTLLQGSAESELDFEAFLESDAFPLPEETRVSIDLSYTYGADDPYRLVFRASDAAGDAQSVMKTVKARWTPKGPRDLDTLPVPPFPDKPSWEALRSWPKIIEGRRESESDLLEWIEAQIRRLMGGDSSVAPEMADRLFAQRVNGRVKSNLKTDANQMLYFFAGVDGEDDVFCHQTDILDDVTKLKQGDEIWLNVDRSGWKGPQGRNISFSRSTQESFEAKLRAAQARRRNVPQATVEKAYKDLKFPTYTVWNHGRSLTEVECPNGFRQIVQRGTQHSLSLYQDSGTPGAIRREAFLFLSRLHQDAPKEVQQRLADVSKSEIGFDEAMAIAYFIGACTTKWQEVALLNVLAGNASRKFRILSVALWRSPQAIGLVSRGHLETILPALLSEIEMFLKKSDKEKDRKHLVNQFEVLLALLRSRESGNTELRAILSPDSEFGLKFVNLIDQAIDLYVTNRYELFTRVSLEVEKPEFAKDQPDLLYALRLFMTGDDQARMIRISGVSEGDEDWR